MWMLLLLHARLAISWKAKMWKANTRKNALRAPCTPHQCWVAGFSDPDGAFMVLCTRAGN